MEDGPSSESRYTFTLSENALVEVLKINRDVTIQTHDSAVAEVIITRRAEQQKHLKYHQVVPKATPAGLRIEGKEDRKAYKRGITVEQQVTLRVPRQVNLEVRNIGGSVWIGEVEGPVTIEQVSNSLEMRVAGNAELTAKSIGGGIYISLPTVPETDPQSAAVSMTTRIGSGGVPILINKVSGSVFIR